LYSLIESEERRSPHYGLLDIIHKASNISNFFKRYHLEVSSCQPEGEGDEGNLIKK